MDANGQRDVVLFLSAGFSLDRAGRLVEAFNIANCLPNVDGAYRMQFVSASGDLIQSSSGVQIATDALGDKHCRQVCAFFHLHGDGEIISLGQDLFQRLREVRASARWVVDGMRFVAVGDSGWAVSGEDATAAVQPDDVDGAAQLAATDDALLTAMDMFRCDLGENVAQEISRSVSGLVDERFARSMWAVRELRASPSIRASAQRLRIQGTDRISIADIAQSALMSERNFLRRFKKEIGVTPTEFVLGVRLERACHMLVFTNLPADKVARRTGLSSGERLAKLFRQRMSISPLEYRMAERSRLAGSGTYDVMVQSVVNGAENVNVNRTG
ncbi:helix-turn-helix domain-containing protein [Burkholderia sp. PU8-34]